MGYPGHIWSHGLEYNQREGEIKRLYAGGPDAGGLQGKYDIKYAALGPHERDVANVNFTRFTKVGEAGGYCLYKIAQP